VNNPIHRRANFQVEAFAVELELAAQDAEPVFWRLREDFRRIAEGKSRCAAHRDIAPRWQALREFVELISEHICLGKLTLYRFSRFSLEVFFELRRAIRKIGIDFRHQPVSQ
jgi:hypothetical protein